MKSLKLLVYADINLNIMDGSSVWLTGLLQLLAGDKRIDLDFLQKAPDKGGPLNNQVRNISRVNSIEKYPTSMKAIQAAQEIRQLDRQNNYDRVLARGDITLGLRLVEFLSGRLAYYTLEPFQRMKEFADEEKTEIGRMLRQTAFAIVQSERMRASYSNAFSLPESHIYVLSPFVPPINNNPGLRNRLNTLCYTGKFSRDWGTTDLIDTFKAVKKELPYAKLNIAGNKFHGDLGGRKVEIENFFSSDENVHWAGIVSRQRSINLTQQSDIGFALRSTDIDNDQSQELSTKLFEYMSAGKPVLLRPTRVHRQLLGDSYPLFCRNSNEAAKKCLSALTNVSLYDKAAKMVYSAYKCYARSVNQFSLVERLLSFTKTTILFAGHDFKFLTGIVQSFEEDENYTVLFDKWNGHAGHDEDVSQTLLNKADIIFCEWGLGNIRWYSKHKKPGQRLIVRAHRQEVDRLDYLRTSVCKNIDHYIFIAPYRYEEFVSKVGIPRSKAKMVFNAVNAECFSNHRRANSGYTLGLVGMVPWSKRLDLAVKILDLLWQKRETYTLRVKGKRPEQYPWMLSGFKDQMARYDRLFRMINQASWKDNVIFDPHGNDMADWYQKVDFILSLSDYEGSHQAVAEGIAAGAQPLILPWAGADTVYPEEYIFKNTDEIVDYLVKCHGVPQRSNFANVHFEPELITKQIRYLCESNF